MQIRVLGCSGGIGGERRSTCLRIDDDILIDGGTGLGELSLDEMAAIRHVFLTHSHLDHLAGIPLMVDSIFGAVGEEPLVIHALPETLEVLRRHVFNWAIWPDFTVLPSAGTPVLRFESMDPGEVQVLDGRRIEMIPVNHVVPAVGYRVEDASGAAFAFSGDTTTNDGFWAALNRHPRLDLLIVECAFPDADAELARQACHYCPHLLAEDLAKLQHRPRICLSHLKPGAEDRIHAACLALMPERHLERLSGGEGFRL